MIRAHLFDMDHTLLNSDCDITWKEFCVAHNMAPPDTMEKVERFFDDYDEGKMNVVDFNLFQLQEFKNLKIEEIRLLSQQHFEEFVRKNVRQKAFNYIKNLQANNEEVWIVSSTNVELVKPVALFFGIDKLYCTFLEFDENGCATGNISGVYVANEGKVVVSKIIAEKLGCSMADLAYYGDSVNDRKVLEAVGHPFAVSPSPQLLTFVQKNNWPILSWAD